MIRIKKSDRKQLLALLQQAVKMQVQLYDQFAAIEDLIGHVTGLDAWVLREAADWDKPEYVQLTRENLDHLLQEVAREE